MEALVARNRDQLISAMPLVKGYTAKLASLSEWWTKIALIGKINSLTVAATILSDMDDTKRKFIDLQHKLIENLIQENLKKEIVDNASRAQVAIDILIRNLFERTADVGFLATDDDIREFLGKDAPDHEDMEFIKQRLNEYVKKYSVYDEIVIFSPDGKVRAHLDDNNPVTHSHDPLIRKTLDNNTDYVETFRHSDLQPHKRHSLIYSARITRTNSPNSEVIGVLCLCFRFDNEMEGIFKNLLNEQDKATLMILDEQGKVISSSNESHIGIGQRFRKDSQSGITRHQGTDYLANTLHTNGYQGFHGLGWSGHVMAPIHQIFKTQSALREEEVDDDMIDRAQMFSTALKEIRTTSTVINDNLKLVVLNGKITAARNHAKEFMPVLEAIKRIGEDTANLFSKSISNLQATVINSHLDDVTFMASLAVDIMDRNLYERANDCRWWALTSAFRRILKKTRLDDEDRTEITDILQYINGLYTVYTNLYLYNKKREIIAVSNPEETHWIGETVEEISGAGEALTIYDSQKYAVSPFRKTSLYEDRHTYIYNAPVTNIDFPSEILGGIGIVFDSEPQFRSMLEDALPRDESGRIQPESFGMFVDRSGHIISIANNDEYRVGDRCPDMDNEIATLGKGMTLSKIINHSGMDFAMGVSVSQGYREYKTTSDYENDVIALFFVPF